MKLRNTLILLVLLAAGLAYVYFFESRRPTTEEGREKRLKPFEFSSKDVTALTVERGKEELVCQRVADKEWQITKPFSWRADDSPVGKILSDLEFLKAEGLLIPEKGKSLNLADYGLDKPRGRIVFAEGQREHELLVGTDSAVGQKVYARALPSAKVFVLDRKILDTLNTPWNQFRDSGALDFESDRIVRVMLKYPEREVAAEKEGDQWWLSSPMRVRAGEQEITSLLNTLLALKVQDWVTDEPGDLEKYGLTRPHVEVVLTSKEGEKEAEAGLLVGSQRKDSITGRDLLYAKRTDAPAVFAVRQTILDDLVLSPRDLRDRVLISFQVGDARKVVFGGNRSPLSIERAGEGADWYLSEPLKIPADQDSVSNFVRKVRDARIREFVEDQPSDLAKYGLSSPEARVGIELRPPGKESQSYGLNLGVVTGSYYAKRDDEDAIYMVAPDLLLASTDSYLAFRTRDLLELGGRELTAASVSRAGVTYDARVGAGGKWELLAPFKVGASAQFVNAVRERFGKLTVEKFVSDQVSSWATYGLEEPHLVVRATFTRTGAGGPGKQEGGEESHELHLGGEVEPGAQKGRYARLAKEPLLFVMGSQAVTELERDPVDRRIFNFVSTDVDRIAFAYPDQEIVLNRDELKWRFSKPIREEADASKITELLTKLGSLECSKYLPELPQQPADKGLDRPVLDLLVRLKSGEQKLTIGARTPEGDHYARASGVELEFVLSANLAASFIKKVEDLKPRPKSEAED